MAGEYGTNEKSLKKRMYDVNSAFLPWQRWITRELRQKLDPSPPKCLHFPVRSPSIDGMLHSPFSSFSPPLVQFLRFKRRETSSRLFSPPYLHRLVMKITKLMSIIARKIFSPLRNTIRLTLPLDVAVRHEYKYGRKIERIKFQNITDCYVQAR